MTQNRNKSNILHHTPMSLHNSYGHVKRYIPKSHENMHLGQIRHCMRRRLHPQKAIRACTITERIGLGISTCSTRRLSLQSSRLTCKRDLPDKMSWIFASYIRRLRKQTSSLFHCSVNRTTNTFLQIPRLAMKSFVQTPTDLNWCCSRGNDMWHN